MELETGVCFASRQARTPVLGAPESLPSTFALQLERCRERAAFRSKTGCRKSNAWMEPMLLGRLCSYFMVNGRQGLVCATPIAFLRRFSTSCRSANLISIHDHNCFGSATVRHFSDDADAGGGRDEATFGRPARGRCRQSSGVYGVGGHLGITLP